MNWDNKTLERKVTARIQETENQGDLMKTGLIDVDGHNFPNIPLILFKSWRQTKMEINKWIRNYKVQIFPWVDGKRIYCNMAYYRPGQSIHKPPVWENTVYITNDEKGRKLAYDFTETLVNYVVTRKIPDGKELTITVDKLPLMAV